MSDDDDKVQISSQHATVDDLFAHAQLLLSEAETDEQRREANNALAAAEVALERAGGDRSVKLAAIADETFLRKH
jgi:hypothetical protein